MRDRELRMARALVVGRARGVWEEVAALQEMALFDAVLVVGKVGVIYPGEITHWVSFHAHGLPRWAAERDARGFPEAASYWTSPFKGTTVAEVSGKPVGRVGCVGGSSGLIAVTVALEKVEADRVALAGIPMDNERGHVDDDLAWNEAQHYRQAWVDALPRLSGRVRSMSGWTKELLGGEPPTPEWLAS